MKVLNIGSLNIDYVYEVEHHVLSKETISSTSLNVFAGGKGLNQSIALAKANATVCHAGKLGEEGQFLLDTLNQHQVDTRYVQMVKEKSGHAIIQLDPKGENCILLHGGANQMLDVAFIDEVLSNFDEKDILILQNETNMLKEIIDKACDKKMTIVLNPSPFNEKIKRCNLEKVDYFLLNEVEGMQMCETENEDEIIKKLKDRFPKAKFVLTLGEKGAIYVDETQIVHQEIFEVKAIDTTAAGDTFTGYFIAGLVEGLAVKDNLKRCAKASSMCVSRNGAAASIPKLDEVCRQMNK
ncbi:MAG: ribokinase [Erysipelotrichaceae bacterium]